MDIEVAEVEGLPAHTYISVRYGEQRRQAPFRCGEVLSFPATADGKAPKAYTVDVFRKVGSKQVSLAGILALGGTVESEGLVIPSLEIQGSPIQASLRASLAEAPPQDVEDSKRQQVARKAKQYLEKHAVQTALHEMFAKLLERQPGDPLGFMVDFLEQQREEALERQGAEQRDFAAEPGLGPGPLPGFAESGGPEDLPDLAHHHSLVADALRADPGLYERLRGERTELGVLLAQCIKPGMDCPGHELVKVAGVVAGDAECYERFAGLFDPVVAALHSGWSKGMPHPDEGNPAKLTNSRIDATGRYAVYASMEARRNLRGFRLPTCCSKAERREVERILTAATGEAALALRGSYLPLRRSQSFAPKTGGMAAHQEERLRASGMLFAEPDSRIRLAAGLGRDWPDARGVLVAEAQGLFVWCNEEDHLRFFARQHTVVDLKRLWKGLNQVLAAVSGAAEREGSGYSRAGGLGFTTVCPSRLGSALRMTVSLKVPLLAASADLPGLCRAMELQVSQEVGSAIHGSVWNVASGDSLGLSEIDLINNMIEGCGTLVALEQRLERGEPIYDAMPGLGPEASPGFPVDFCPAALPELAGHHSYAAAVLRESPGIYASLRRRTTPGGMTFARCIKPGIDDRGHPAARSAGLVAGDAGSFEAFRELFEPVVRRLHGELPTGPQPVDTRSAKLSNTHMDAAGLHVQYVRVELRRNLRGLPLAPLCSRAERREVERLAVKALGAAQGGQYLPLRFSRSHSPLPGGMDRAQEAQLQEEHLLFAEPASVARLAAGIGREWPDARGLFLSGEGDLAVWCNEEDHLRFRVKQRGPDLKAAFGRAFAAAHEVEASLRQEGAQYLRDDRLGYLTVDPMHLGGAIRCSAALQLPSLSILPDFAGLCEAFGLSVAWLQGVWEVSSGSSLGVSEVEVANELLEGCARLVGLEALAAKGGDISEQVRAMVAAGGGA